MKKIIYIVFISLLTLFITSCSMGRHETPLGIWRSTDPDITLYLDSNYLHPNNRLFLGVYIENDEVIKLFIQSIAPRDPALHIYANNIYEIFTSGSRRHRMLFSGRFHIDDDDRLHLVRSAGIAASPTAARTDVTEIIFYRVEDYEPIDPRDWRLRPPPS